ncbi:MULTISPECIES: hypothetical protein [unclassified Nostoc]|jgi:hypothetical protein|uniref:hypothetical protein n=1 Tax=unclassified Nostoc TaxID=2593658 RepID=UPI0025AA4F0D|nr:MULTISPECIES: hypothetical protein [unclassified Nostoc]MDM9584534.1 hypothetical protein [Nostoc sp. GT001]MDZ7946974.1 hypothetical protein [Nostoc sp. EfeVER01]MDZ7993165.1 hypothetical protein [Nostoc sp. EspVER01]MDZ8090056.1 hypothetical protein [Nostoc sp. DedQUE12b]
MNNYAKWFSRVTWVGIIVNMLFVIPSCFFPELMLTFLKMHIPEPIIWVRAAGMLLFIISAFYIPGALDPYRYQATAWISIFPSRAFGSTFFICAVLFFGQDKGFLSIAFVDLFFGLAELILLTLAMRSKMQSLQFQ